MHSLAVLAIFATTVAMVITRPYRLSEGISASLGAAGILALGDVTLGQAAGVLSGTLTSWASFWA